MKVEQQYLYTKAEHKRDKLQQQTTVNRSYFFCLSASSGTEGIKHVKNFVPFLALYRGFLVPQMPPLWAICSPALCSVLSLLRINSSRGCDTL